jgi:hypothetical protein
MKLTFPTEEEKVARIVCGVLDRTSHFSLSSCEKGVSIQDGFLLKMLVSVQTVAQPAYMEAINPVNIE